MARTMPDTLASRVAELCTRYLRAPSGYATDDQTAAPVIDFVPPLTTEEQATLANIIALARSGMTHLTPTEYDTIRSQLATIRDLRQLGRNAFMALTTAERDRLLYDAQAATTTILLALLRE